MQQLQLVHSRTSYTGDGQPIDNTDYIRGFQPGDTFTVDVAAPGYGRKKYRIEREDEAGLWGVLLEDTTRVFDSTDVH